jgi:hypothetical protein
MKKVEFLQSYKGADTNGAFVDIGQVDELEDEQAARLVTAGRAKYIEKPKPEKVEQKAKEKLPE